MTDHPSTFRGEDNHDEGIQWDDHAVLHQTGDGDGLLYSTKGLRRGTFAEIIAHVMAYPAEKRVQFYIEKAGDREYQAQEIERLAHRDDFPHKD